MKPVKIKPNQSIFDIALEQYGNVNAVEEIITLNPYLRNDPAALTGEAFGEDDYFIDAALCPGDEVLVDETSHLVLKHILKQIQSPITTYEYTKDE